jgi:hypothetical protein
MKVKCESADKCTLECEHKEPHIKNVVCRGICERLYGIPESRCKPVESSARIIGEGSARLLGVDLDRLPVGGGA